MKKDRKSLEKLERLVKLNGYLEVQSALHIGKGRALDPGAASDLPVIKDIRGFPFIPGSSFKGAIRSLVEALVRGLGNKKIWSCNLIDGECCLDPQNPEAEFEVNGKKKKFKDLLPEEIPIVVLENICDVCNLFGHPLFASRLRFVDLPIKEGTWNGLMLQVRDGVAIDRESGTAKEGAKFDFETVSAGTKFNLEIIADNVEEWELGLLFFALDFLNNGYAFLGGNTSRGLGKVKVEIENYLDLSLVDLLEKEPALKTDIKEFKEKCLLALKKVIKEAENDTSRTESTL